MAEYLVIRLGTDPDQSADWIAVDSNGTRRTPPVTGPLSEAVRDVGERTVIALVPATAVTTTSVDIPVKGGPRLRAALPFALEDQLAEDIDNLHFAIGPRRDDGRLPVAVVARSQMDEWMELLRDAGLSAAKVIPENHGLAKIPGTMSMLVAEDQLLFNDGADAEFAMQGVKPSDALAVTGHLDAADDESDGKGHLLVYAEPAEESRFEDDWNVLRHELASVDINLLPDGVLPRLAVTVAAGRGINLLQGPYGPRVQYGALLRPWRNAAALLLGAFIVALAVKAGDYYRLSAEQESLQAQFTEEYRQIRPGDTSEITNPAQAVDSVRREFGATTSTDVFLPSLQQLSAALAQNSSARIEAISYRAGVINVRLTAPDVATLDNIQKLVSSSGRFIASIQSTDQVGDKISSRIQIRESGV